MPAKISVSSQKKSASMLLTHNCQCCCNSKKTIYIVLIILAMIIVGVFLTQQDLIGKFETKFKLDQKNLQLNTTLDGVTPNETTPPTKLSETQAFNLASVVNSSCTQTGAIGNFEVYNPNSQTWWFTLIPTQKKPGCNPACVVYPNGNLEVNWRCTGLKTP